MRSRAAPGSGIPLSLVTTRSALARWSIAPVNEVFMPSARTATKTTSAMPDHERRGGDRRARRVAGRVLAGELAGRMPEALERPADERGQRVARRSARSSRRRRTRAASRHPSPRAGWRPLRCRTVLARGSATPRHADARRPRPGGGGSCRPARVRRPRACAATGGTRVARTAGTQRGGQGHADADDQADDDRARRELHPAARDAHAGRVEQARRGAWRTRARRAARATDATTPSSERLGADAGEDLAAGGAERAQQRELAAALRDGDREGVEDDERADEQRGAREGEQHRREERADAVVDLLRRVGGRPARRS